MPAQEPSCQVYREKRSSDARLRIAYHRHAAAFVGIPERPLMVMGKSIVGHPSQLVEEIGVVVDRKLGQVAEMRSGSKPIM